MATDAGWTCGCGVYNDPDRARCGYCSALRASEASAPAEPAPDLDGWTCGCGVYNDPDRARCGYCSAPRASEASAPVEPAPDPDGWTCGCGVYNDPDRARCGHCSAPRASEASAPADAAPGPDGWTCGCGVYNDPDRARCGRCSAPRSPSPAAAEPLGWTCACGDYNEADRPRCGACGASPDAPPIDAPSAPAPPASGWACGCGATNDADRPRCGRCSRPRSLQSPAARPRGRRIGAPGESARLVGAAGVAAPAAVGPTRKARGGQTDAGASAALAAATPPASPGAAPSGSPRAAFKLLEPIAALPRGAPAERLTSRTLQLDLPRSCCCCLGPPSGPPYQVAVVKGGRDRINWLESLPGLVLWLGIGFGWYTTDRELGMNTAMRCPICPGCARHAAGSDQAFGLGGLAGIVVAVGYLYATRGPKVDLGDQLLVAGGLALAVFLAVWLGLGTVLSLTGPSCGGARPVRMRYDGTTFFLTFANAAYGRRVDELNPRRG